MPLAAYAQWNGDASALQLDAAWGDPDGRLAMVRVSQQQAVRDLQEAEALGQRVADALRAAGAQPPAAEA